MDRWQRDDGVIPLAGRCLYLIARYALLLVCYALASALEGLLRLSRS